MLAEEEKSIKAEGESARGLGDGRSMESTPAVDWTPKCNIKQSPAFWSKCHVEGGLKRVAWPPPPDTHFSGDMNLEMDAQSQAPGIRTHVQDGPFLGEIPPGQTVSLLEQAPIREAPASVTPSQPVFKRRTAPTRMRGDDKWPPLAQSANPEITMSPVVRPKKVTKDYGKFFSQNSLSPTYPSYKAPPGTQHFAIHDL